MSENAAGEELLEKWRRLQPLSTENERRLWLKLRLEWNYNSNHIEGNTLSYGETKLLLLHGKTRGEHDLREYEEMKAHDVAIDYVREMARASREMTEVEIRNLNLIILKEPFWKEAVTPDGEPTRIQIVPGEYKSRPNNVRTVTGEIFEYADPVDVPPRMRDLVLWLRAALEENSPDPVPLAAKLHHDFVLIHPFADGNGRIARLLVNYLLLRLGYPPIVVKSARKSAYLDALRRADAGDLEPLKRFFQEELVWSLELGIKAASGEDLEEHTDIDKEIEIFKKRQRLENRKAPSVSNDDLKNFYLKYFLPIFEAFERRSQPVKDLFERAKLLGNGPREEPGANWRAIFDRELDSGFGERDSISLKLKLMLHGYLAEGEKAKGMDRAYMLQLTFLDEGYKFEYCGEVLQGHYSALEELPKAEALVQTCLKKMFSNILRSAEIKQRRDSA